MYESRFGITGPPFQLSPDPNFYFDSRVHRRVLEQLRLGLAEGPGFTVISGEVGAGKTTLIRALVAELDPAQWAISNVVSTQLDAAELLFSTLIGFGVQPSEGPSEDLAPSLLRFLVRLKKAGRRSLLIVDEAQNLHHDAFDQLATLAAGESSRRPSFHVILLGQPELRAMFESDDFESLRELVRVSCHLGPIDRAETGPYIEHRLRKVGWQGSPSFDDAAFEEIFGWTNGIPRRINLLCNRLMLSRFLSDETCIDRATVIRTARDLRAELGEADAPPDPSTNRFAMRPAPAGASAGEGSPVSTPEVRPRVPRPAALPVRLQAPLLVPMEHGPLLCVAAGQGDHVKAAALMHALAARDGLPPAKLVRVHNNEALDGSRSLFCGLDIDKGLINLGIAELPSSDAYGELKRVFEFVVDHLLPRAVIVFDGSSPASICAGVARAKEIPVVHIGAGIRVDKSAGSRAASHRTADHLADLLYTSDAHASEVLADEGIAAERIHCAGNLLADALRIATRAPRNLLRHQPSAVGALSFLTDRKGYALMVLGHPAHVGDAKDLIDLLAIVRDVSRDLPVVWPMPGRLKLELKGFAIDTSTAGDRVHCLAAQAYPDYLALLGNATCVLTDSWTVQEEATLLGIPCLGIGACPEEGITSSVGSNTPVGKNRTHITRAVWECIFNGGKRGRVPDMWDGKTAARIASYLSAWLPSNADPASRRAIDTRSHAA